MLFHMTTINLIEQSFVTSCLGKEVCAVKFDIFLQLRNSGLINLPLLLLQNILLLLSGAKESHTVIVKQFVFCSVNLWQRFKYLFFCDIDIPIVYIQHTM